MHIEGSLRALGLCWRRLRLSILLAVAVVAPTAARADPLELVGKTTTPYVTFDSGNGAPMQLAATMLAHDLEARGGRAPVVQPDLKAGRGTRIIFGRADAPMIARLLRANHIDPSPVRGRWEVYYWRKAVRKFGKTTAIPPASSRSRRHGVKRSTAWCWRSSAPSRAVAGRSP